MQILEKKKQFLNRIRNFASQLSPNFRNSGLNYLTTFSPDLDPRDFSSLPAKQLQLGRDKLECRPLRK